MAQKLSEATRLAAMQLWAQGLNGSQIAKKIGLPSRSAALGLIYRLRKKGFDLAYRSSGSTRPPASKPGRKPQGRVMYPRDISLFELQPRSCRWPSGDPHINLTFCGARALDNCPYCEQHAKKAYTSYATARDVRNAASLRKPSSVG